MFDFRLYSHYFEKGGWKESHLFQIGTKWTKGDQEVIRCSKGFLLNHRLVDDSVIHDLLKVPEREIAVYDVLIASHYSSKQALAFLDGIRWADNHPIDKEKKDEHNTGNI